MADRTYHIVLYGATGFVGERAAGYLARHRQPDLRFAIAGRSRDKLETLRARLGKDGVGVLVADSADARALDKMAASAYVVLNTAGPFRLYGDDVVAACVRRKTHYCDITGETVWARRLIDRHHAPAEADGTRIVPFCGFDSVPSDLGTFLAARYMQRSLGVPCERVDAYFQMFGGFNGGTIASDIERHASGDIEIGRNPFLLDPPDGHSTEQIERNRDPSGVHFDDGIGAWVGPFIMGPINTRVVRRSAALYRNWGEPYGPRFAYQEYTKFDRPFGLAKAAAVTGLMTGFERAMSNDTLRGWLRKRLPQPGAGPSERTMARGWFTTELIGRAHDGRRVQVRVHFDGDPSNRATLRLLCESGLCLAFDGERLPGGPARGGVLTPATALGDALVPRLRAAGFRIEIEP